MERKSTKLRVRRTQSGYELKVRELFESIFRVIMITFSRPGFRPGFLRLVSVYEEVMAKNKDTNHYECDQPVSGNFINCGALLAIALQKSAFKSIAVHLPIPN